MSYVYDGENRLVSACQSTSCGGSGFARFDSTYDGEGHRIRLVETPATGTATSTEFRYEGDAVTSEVSTTGATVITRTFTTDEAGAIVRMTIAGDPVSLHNGDYLVVWNGHGDATGLYEIEANGTLTVANRFTYSTWGTPTVSTADGYADLRFRYLYVGRDDVQWDSSTAVPAGLLYMHARTYSPEFGRFLQPDPAGAETNLYGYAGNSPVTNIDPSGLDDWWRPRKIFDDRIVVPWYYEGVNQVAWYAVNMAAAAAATALVTAFAPQLTIPAIVRSGAGGLWAFGQAYLGPDIKGGDVFVMSTWDYDDRFVAIEKQYRNGYLIKSLHRTVKKATCLEFLYMQRTVLTGNRFPTGRWRPRC